MKMILPLFLFIAPFAAAGPVADSIVPTHTARFLPIAGDGWSGSSVNVSAGLQNTLVTDGATQFAAFYAGDGTLVLARRELGSDHWETRRTRLRADVADAHRTVAIGVDGTGVLHVAWNHHNDPLNYARGIAPGSMDLGTATMMTGKHEDSVTYPRFLRQPDGDLFFLYRDGGSGGGNLVLNRYDTDAGEWSQVHDKLIDGEGERSAYAAASVDAEGVLHLAWVWRETPDVSTNHDLCYARSEDGGITWTGVERSPLPVPMTAAAVEPAVVIAQGRSLMNPPSLTVDEEGRPYLANYWSPDGSDIPQYHLVHHDGERWSVQQVTDRQTPFLLEGTATRRPPLSRCVLFTSKDWRKPREVFLVYRDDEHDERIVVAECRDLSTGDWQVHVLTQSPVGAWEPSADPAQWQRMRQVHMLVQVVDQRDGDDSSASDAPASVVGSLIWSPFLAGLAGRAESPPFPAAGQLDQPLVAGDILALSKRVADWQLAQPSEYAPDSWVMAPFYIGALALSEVSDASRYREAVLKQSRANRWKPASRTYHADDHCISQVYLELFEHQPEASRLVPTRERFEEILARPSPVDLQWGLPNADDRWSWCDALFMAPAAWLMVHEVTGDERFLDFMNREWWATVDALYVPADRLFARDQSYLDAREPNGRGLYWSRGNGWVIAGLARVLDRFPREHPDYPRYRRLYVDMAGAILAAQQADGLWRPGMLDPAAHPVRETSGSAFHVFGLAWGVNRGLLDRERFLPAVRRGWHGLANCVTTGGKLEHVQPIGAAPEGFAPDHSEPFGVGAFLLAGTEVHRLAKGSEAILHRRHRD